MTLDIDIRCGDSLAVLRAQPSQSVDMVITSPPYFNLRNYGSENEVGQEATVTEYLDNLLAIFTECRRVLKDEGSLWVNIDDVYINQGLACVPDRLKIILAESGWLCRNEIIWHKPNAMPSSAKTRFNNDYEKLYFFTKSKYYHFETQYEPGKTTASANKTKKKAASKYLDDEQEASVRQGMNRSRGSKIIAVRKSLPEQKRLVEFLRSRTTVDTIAENSDLRRTTIEHWFRRDRSGFAYPSVEDWNAVKWLVDDFSQEFQDIDQGLTEITYETDDILKNADKGRIKRAVWSIPTKPFKGCHFAPYPESLVESPIRACCPEGGTVLDPFMGSGTTGVVCKRLNRNFIGIDLNPNFIEIATERIQKEAKI